MRKLLILIFALLLFSCEDDFSPKVDFEEEYTVYSFIKGYDSYQAVMLQRTYDFEGFNPLDYKENTFVEGAQVSVFYNDSVFVFEERIVDNINNRRLDEPQVIYVNENLFPVPDSELRLVVVLPNGEELTAETKTPKFNRLRFDTSADSRIPANDGIVDIWWDIVDGDDEDQIYLPELKIAYYYVEDDSSLTYKEKHVPLNYFTKNDGEEVANYPLPVNERVMQYTMTAFDKTMQYIGDGVGDKSRIVVENAVLQLLLLDDHLVPYYMSIETFLGGYTVLLDQSDYTNVTGGRGIFGSFFVDRTHTMYIEKSYIKSFGYEKK